MPMAEMNDTEASLDEAPTNPAAALAAKLHEAAATLETEGAVPRSALLTGLVAAILAFLPEPSPDNDAPLVIFTEVPAVKAEAFGDPVDLRFAVIDAFAATFGWQPGMVDEDGAEITKARYVTERVNVFLSDVAGDFFVRSATAEREKAAREFAAGAMKLARRPAADVAEQQQA